MRESIGMSYNFSERKRSKREILGDGMKKLTDFLLRTSSADSGLGNAVMDNLSRAAVRLGVNPDKREELGIQDGARMDEEQLHGVRKELMKGAAVLTAAAALTGGIVSTYNDQSARTRSQNRITELARHADTVGPQEFKVIWNGDIPEVEPIAVPAASPPAGTADMAHAPINAASAENGRALSAEEKHIISLNQILNIKSDSPVEYNSATVEAIKNHWKKRYSEEPALRNSLISAFKKMGAWEPYLRDNFQAMNVPADFIYLAIIESHWEDKASEAGAEGPYQIIESTRKLLHEQDIVRIQKNHIVNDSKDPEVASKGVSFLLYDELRRINLYNKRFGGDYFLDPSNEKSWRLPLAWNNGNIYKSYWRFAKQNKLPLTDAGFNKYIENDLNASLAKIRNASREHIVKPGQTLKMIARQFGVTESAIEAANHRKLSIITKGQKLTIPYSEEQRERLLREMMADKKENLNYPAKFYAVLELIRERFVMDQEEPVDFDTQYAQPVKPLLVRIVPQKGDTVSKLCQKYRINASELIASNPELTRDKKGRIVLPVGRKLTIPNRVVWVWPTLSVLAKEYGIELAELKKLNPAILSVDVQLRDIPVRFPKKNTVNKKDNTKQYAQNDYRSR